VLSWIQNFTFIFSFLVPASVLLTQLKILLRFLKMLLLTDIAQILYFMCYVFGCEIILNAYFDDISVFSKFF